MSIIVQVKNLKMHFTFASLFRTKYLKAIDSLDLDIRAGESIGIVGESGSGKTTLAKNILGLYTPTAGEILFEGSRINPPLRKKSRTGAKPRISIVFQDPYSSLNPKMTIYDILSEPLHQAKREITRELLAENLNRVGIAGDYLFRYPHEFSGGQRQRIAIARALINNPSFMILDEPTSGLDVSVQAQILNLLLEIKEKYNLTYLFISHNLAVIYYVCNRIAVMYQGKIVEIASRDRLIQNPRHPYTIRLLSAVPEMTGAVGSTGRALNGRQTDETSTGAEDRCRYHDGCVERLEKCDEVEPVWHEVEDDHCVLCHRGRKTE